MNARLHADPIFDGPRLSRIECRETRDLVARFSSELLLLSPRFEERAQYGRRFFIKHPSADGDPMVELRIVSNIEDRTCAATLRIRARKDKPFDARGHARRGAHDAGFLGDVQRRVRQPPAAAVCAGLTQRDNFGVRRGVVVCFFLIETDGCNASADHQNRANGNVASLGGDRSKFQCFAHELGISSG